MSESILISVKKLLGISEDYEYFDADILMDINSVLMILHQMGVGPDTPMMIEDASARWSDFFDDKTDIQAVKTYIALKVRMMFDPPQSSAHANAINENIKELEWRLYSAESSKNFDPDEYDDYSNSRSSCSRKSHNKSSKKCDYDDSDLNVTYKTDGESLLFYMADDKC